MKKIIALIAVAATLASCGCKGWSCQKRYVIHEQKHADQKKDA